MLIPTVYAVQRKQSISIGIWGHCLGYTIGELLALAAVERGDRRAGRK